jgi:hypothetical protein
MALTSHTSRFRCSLLVIKGESTRRFRVHEIFFKIKCDRAAAKQLFIEQEYVPISAIFEIVTAKSHKAFAYRDHDFILFYCECIIVARVYDRTHGL